MQNQKYKIIKEKTEEKGLVIGILFELGVIEDKAQTTINRNRRLKKYAVIPQWCGD